jgi:hypothetical protein
MDKEIADKFKEAEFFLSEMENSLQDDDRFKYMYSAFLSAGQSTLYYLLTRYKDIPDFYEWYYGKKADQHKVGGRIERAEIKHLMNARGSLVHSEPLPQGATRGRELSASIILASPDEQKGHVDKHEGCSTFPVTKEPKKPRTIVRWLINEDSYMRYETKGRIYDDTKYISDIQKKYSAKNGKTEILSLSKGELEEVKKLILECESKFP